MNPVNKAIWFVESHLADDLTLDEIAAVADVSRFHLVRAFGVATGYPVMQYVRGRRLTVAARTLLQGAPDILAVALEAGYGSHEAFTRAFRGQFGYTPEQVRARRCPEDLKLMEPIKMDATHLPTLPPPRLEDGRPLLIAGLSERYACESGNGIPSQWQRFQPHLGQVPAQVGQVAYGVCCNFDDESNYDYVCGVEVAHLSDLPPELSGVRIPAQRYAVFTHGEHVSTVRRTLQAIWSKWLPESGYQAAAAPTFERYGEAFDPLTGAGGFEIWIPIQR